MEWNVIATPLPNPLACSRLSVVGDERKTREPSEKKNREAYSLVFFSLVSTGRLEQATNPLELEPEVEINSAGVGRTGKWVPSWVGRVELHSPDCLFLAGRWNHRESARKKASCSLFPKLIFSF